MSSSHLPQTNNAAPAAAPGVKGRAHRQAAAKVKFGIATIDAQTLTAAELEQRLALSSDALTRAKPKLTTAGVRIYRRWNVPLYPRGPTKPAPILPYPERQD